MLKVHMHRKFRILPPLSPWQESIPPSMIPAQIIFSVISHELPLKPYIKSQHLAFVYPVNLVYWSQLANIDIPVSSVVGEVLPQPLTTRLFSWLKSISEFIDNRQTAFTYSENGMRVFSFKMAKSKSIEFSLFHRGWIKILSTAYVLKIMVD